MEREYNEAQAGVAGAGLSEFIGRYEGGDPRFYDLLRQIGELHGRKNTDYTKGSLQGHLGNFHRSSSFKRLYPGFDWTTSFGTAIDFMFKQLDATMVLYSTRRESVTGESIPERLRDVAVYALIGALLFQDEKLEMYGKVMETAATHRPDSGQDFPGKPPDFTPKAAPNIPRRL